MAGNITVTTTFGFHIDKRLKLVVPTKDVYSIHVLNITVNILGDNQTYISKNPPPYFIRVYVHKYQWVYSIYMVN